MGNKTAEQIAEEAADAQRLTRLIAAFKKKTRDRKASDTIGRRCGWNDSSTLSHYKNGRKPLSAVVLRKLSIALECDPADISPRLAPYVAMLDAGLANPKAKFNRQQRDESPEQRLLRYFQTADDSGKELIMHVAKREADMALYIADVRSK